MKFHSEELVKSIRSRYTKGTRIELGFTNDSYTKLKCGDQGLVSFVDDTGTVFVDWDSGSKLGLIYGEDSFKIVR